MNIAITELIALLLALGNFGVDANPKAPDAAVIMRYAPERFDVMVHFDYQSVIPRNYKVLKEIADHASAKDDGVTAKVGRLVREAEMGRDIAKSMAGFDPISDIYSITAWLELQTSGDPKVLLAVRGKLSAGKFESLAKMAGLPSGRSRRV